MVGTAQFYHRPLADRVSGLPWYRRIVWQWWLVRLPMFLLAAPAAYGVGAFAYEKLPLLFAALAGMAFESAYIGAIATADQLSTDNKRTRYLWWAVNVAAVLASIACNLLFFSGGTYAAITAEVATHAAPMPILGFFYGLLVHAVASTSAQQAEADRAKAAQARIDTRYSCSKCSHWHGASIQAFHGHRRAACGGVLVDTWE